MGIRNILKIIPEQISFHENKLIEFLKYLNIKKIAVDGNSELYRYFVKHNGNIKFIEDIEQDIKERIENGIDEVWVFDYMGKSSFHIPEKEQELKRRKRNYIKNKYMLSSLKREFNLQKKQKSTPSYGENETDWDKKVLENKINILKKKILKPKQFHFDKLRNLLASYSIMFMNALKGYEGEHIASLLSNTQYDSEFVVDAVLSSDSDILIYKSRNSLIRRGNMIKYYNFKQVCEDLDINHRMLVDCAIVLGTDFNHPMILNLGNLNFKEIRRVVYSSEFSSMSDTIRQIHNIYRRDIDLSEFYNIPAIAKKNIFSLI